MTSVPLDLQKGGGGSPAYFTGNETFVDLSAQAGTAFPMTTSHIGKTIILYSSADGQKFQLLAANNASLAVGKGIGCRALPGSKPIKIINGGTAGTDPILEAFLLPGADCAFFLQSASVPSVTAGTWKGRGYGMFHGPVPVTIPNVYDPGVDGGSIASGNWNNNTVFPNINLTRLSSTLYVALFTPAAATSVVAYAISYNHATDTWTWGTPFTAFSSANTWTIAGAIGLSATTYAVLAWEATNSKISARAATVSGTTITQGPTILSGAWSVNPSSIQSAINFSLVADSATTFFYSCRYDGTHLGITHFSVSGTTLTQDGGGTFASSAPGNKFYNGFSPSANIIELAIPSDGTSYGISRYTYAAGSVTNTWNRKNKSGTSTNSSLICVDSTNRVYYSDTNGSLARIVVNGALTDILEEGVITYPVLTDAAVPASVVYNKYLPLTEAEALILNNAAGGSLSLFDPTISLRARTQIASGTSSDSGAFNHIVAAKMGWGPYMSGAAQWLSCDVNQTNRRLALYYTAANQTVAEGRQLAMQMFDMPRNYDQATQ